MNKRTIILSSIVVLVGTVGALIYINQSSKENVTANNDTPSSKQETTSKDVRQAVWEQLAAEQRQHITWQDGKVSKTTLAEGSTVSNGEAIVKISNQYAGKEIYVVDFTTDSMAIPNNMIVYADAETNVIIGYGLVD